MSGMSKYPSTSVEDCPAASNSTESKPAAASAVLPIAMRCVNTGRLRLGQVCSPAAVQSVCWTLKMVENSSTARPVPVRLKSRLSVLAIACVPVSEKSAPNAYMWATSRVSWVACSVRPRRRPMAPTPSNSGNATVSDRASSIMAEPRWRPDLTCGCAGKGCRLHDVRRRDRERQRRRAAQQGHHPRPAQTGGRNHHDIAADVAAHASHREKGYRIVIRDGDPVGPDVIRAEVIEKPQRVALHHRLDRSVLPHPRQGLAGDRIAHALAHRELHRVLHEDGDRKIHHPKQDGPQRQDRQGSFHQHAAAMPGPLPTLVSTHSWLSYRRAGGIAEPVAAVGGERMPEIPPWFVLVDGGPSLSRRGRNQSGRRPQRRETRRCRAQCHGRCRGGMGWKTWGEGRVGGADDFDAEARRHGERRGEAAEKSRAERAEAAEIWRLRSAAGATGEVWRERQDEESEVPG